MTIDHLPDSRRTQMLDWLRDNKRAAIETLAEHFNVSAMTIHRDVAELVKTGVVQKIHGGVVWVENIPVAAAEGKCEMCNLAAGRIPFVIRESEGQTHTACCPHCGLMLLMHAREVSSVLTTDFLYGKTVSAKAASYVVGSTVQICCAPSVLSFICLDDAQRFVHGFGGALMTYAEAMESLQHE